MTKPLVSIIIPVRVPTSLLKQTLLAIKNQSYSNYEIIVISDKISGSVSPAVKRNLGAKKAKGKYLAFLDDDSPPNSKWLENAIKLFNNHITAVCGPCLTPKNSSISQKATGLLLESFLGSGGAGNYRNQISPPRYVDDYPSVNLIVLKEDFIKVGGFNTHHWPGEDTILCLNLINITGKKILYHPTVIVYHHRRPMLIPLLQQVGRYALHRGLFARIYPQTSFRLGYLLPSFFLIYCFSIPLIFKTSVWYKFPLYLYTSLIIYTFSTNLFKQTSILTALLASVTIPIVHLYYGLLFIIGFLSSDLQFKPHKLAKNNKDYLGG